MLAISAQSEEHARAAALKKATSVRAKATKTLQLETQLRDAAAKLHNEKEKNNVLVCTCKAYLTLLRRRADVMGDKQLFDKCASVAKLGTGSIQKATLAILADEREPPQQQQQEQEPPPAVLATPPARKRKRPGDAVLKGPHGKRGKPASF
jgi:hypothetical protein